MRVAEARELAQTLMAGHLDNSWKLEFDNAKRRFGQCSHSERTISLSKPLVTLNDTPEVRDTILHEIAHALAGSGAGHSYRWKLKAQSVGAKPSRCYDEGVVKPKGNWRVYCPDCPAEGERMRKSRRAGINYCCGACYKRTGKRIQLIWERI